MVCIVCDWLCTYHSLLLATCFIAIVTLQCWLWHTVETFHSKHALSLIIL